MGVRRVHAVTIPTSGRAVEGRAGMRLGQSVAGSADPEPQEVR